MGRLQAIKIVLVTLLTVRTRIKSMTFRKTPEETDLAEDSNAIVGFIIFIVMKPLLLAGMPGFPPEAKASSDETEAVRYPLSPARIASPAPGVTQSSLLQVTGGAEPAPPKKNEFLGRCLGVHRNAIEQEPFILATAIAAKCLGAQAPAQPSVCLGISHGVPQMPVTARWPSCSM